MTNKDLNHRLSSRIYELLGKKPRVKVFANADADFASFEGKTFGKVPSHLEWWLEKLPEMDFVIGSVEYEYATKDGLRITITEKIEPKLEDLLRALGEKYEVLFTNFRSEDFSIRLIANGYQDDRIFDVNLHFDARGGELYYQLDKTLYGQSDECKLKILDLLT